MRLLKRLAIWTVGLYLVTLAGLAGFVMVFPEPRELPQGATVIGLGAAQLWDGSLDVHSRRRAEKAAEIALLTGARRVVFSGSGAPDHEASVGEVMARIAQARGVPAATLQAESLSRSTLQNALFSADLLPPEAVAGPVILVTNRFHLARSWATFKWAGYGPITLMPADTPSEHWRAVEAHILPLEAAKVWINLIRGTGASAAHALGIPRERYIRLLD